MMLTGKSSSPHMKSVLLSLLVLLLQATLMIRAPDPALGDAIAVVDNDVSSTTPHQLLLIHGISSSV